MNTENHSNESEILGILAPILVGGGIALADYHYQLKHQGNVNWQRTSGVALAAAVLTLTITQFGLAPVLSALASAAKVAELVKKPKMLLADVDMNKYLQK